jgi:hypothetical protein
MKFGSLFPFRKLGYFYLAEVDKSLEVLVLSVLHLNKFDPGQF